MIIRGLCSLITQYHSSSDVVPNSYNGKHEGMHTHLKQTSLQNTWKLLQIMMSYLSPRWA